MPFLPHLKKRLSSTFDRNLKPTDWNSVDPPLEDYQPEIVPDDEGIEILLEYQRGLKEDEAVAKAQRQEAARLEMEAWKERLKVIKEMYRSRARSNRTDDGLERTLDRILE